MCQSIDQTEPLTHRKIQTPLVAIGGVKGLGAKAGAMVRMVAAAVWLGPQFQSDLKHAAANERLISIPAR